jgi:hypothetical protein
MKFDTTEYEIGAHFLSALINGDYSGLSDEEARALDQFEANNGPGPLGGHWADIEDSCEEFGRCDVTGERGQTVRIAKHVPTGE